MSKEEAQTDWRSISEEALSGMSQWRQAHPKATFQEIEQEVDARLSRLRSRMVKDLVEQSEASNWSNPQGTDAPVCPNCGGSLRKRGKHSREVQSSGGSQIHLERQFARCIDCGYSFSPWTANSNLSVVDSPLILKRPSNPSSKA